MENRADTGALWENFAISERMKCHYMREDFVNTWFWRTQQQKEIDLIEEADGWRGRIWEIIRQRSDCTFFFFTKRIERLCRCLPSDWGDGYGNVAIGCTVENQDRADYRMPIFLSMPIRHRLVVVAPMLEKIDLSRYLNADAIEEVSVGGESGKYARALDFGWVMDMRRQCDAAGVPFCFHQTGSYLIKDGRQYHIPREHQHSQARKAGLNTAGR